MLTHLTMPDLALLFQLRKLLQIKAAPIQPFSLHIFIHTFGWQSIEASCLQVYGFGIFSRPLIMVQGEFDELLAKE